MRRWYGVLLRLYPGPFREQFGEPMAQAFEDVLRDRAVRGGGLARLVLWIFAETLVGAMKENVAVNIVGNRALARIGIVTGVVLSVPLVAMQFSDEVNWELADFVVAGLMLSGAGLAYELIVRKVKASAYRVGVGVAVLASLMLFWVNLAVGIIGNEENPANAMYAAVVFAGFIAARVARFEARGMARAAYGISLGVVLVGAVAVATGMGSHTVNWPRDVMGATGLFALLFAAAGMLFGLAARRPAQESGVPNR